MMNLHRRYLLLLSLLCTIFIIITGESVNLFTSSTLSQRRYDHDILVLFEEEDQKFHYTYQFLMEYNDKFKTSKTNVTDTNITSSTESGPVDEKIKDSVSTSILNSTSNSPGIVTAMRLGSQSKEGQITTPTMYHDICKEYLLSPDSVSDDYISTDDVGYFYEHLCDILDNDQCKGKDIPFYSLSIGIQYYFTDSICPRDELSSEDHMVCVDSLREQVDRLNQFGLNMTLYEQEIVESKVDRFCRESYRYSTLYHYGTLVPIMSPTHQPTIDVSLSPTSLGTNSNSVFTVTQFPSLKPSTFPSSYDSMIPSRLPSETPTGDPSFKPSVLDSLTPSEYPTEDLTQYPSESPHTAPSSIPSHHPTYTIAAPSETPTADPNRAFSERPSRLPSLTPSHKPSVDPAGELSMSPSVIQTALPSAAQSTNTGARPSTMPSLIVISTKSANPISAPSYSPSSVSSSVPSSTLASVHPTLNNTDNSSILPSIAPSSFPSNVLSTFPTAIPRSISSVPSTSVTMETSKNPSSIPSRSISDPSFMPSSQPSAVQSSVPSSIPSSQPSAVPSTICRDNPGTFGTIKANGAPVTVSCSWAGAFRCGLDNVAANCPEKCGLCTGPPSSAPSASLQPSNTHSLSPSTIENLQRLYTVPYTYVLGFDNSEAMKNVLNGSNGDLMNDVSSTILSYLQNASNVTNRFLQKDFSRKVGAKGVFGMIILRQLQISIENMESMKANHKSRTEMTCPQDFSLSTDCVFVTTDIEFISFANYSYDEVTSVVTEPLKASMNDSGFRDKLGRDEVREVKYLPFDQNNTSQSSVLIGSGTIAIISISVALAAIIIYFVARRLKSSREGRELSDEELQNESASEWYESDNENNKDGLSIEEYSNNLNLEDMEDHNYVDVSIAPFEQERIGTQITSAENALDIEMGLTAPSDYDPNSGISVNSSQPSDMSYDVSMMKTPIEPLQDSVVEKSTPKEADVMKQRSIFGIRKYRGHRYEKIITSEDEVNLTDVPFLDIQDDKHSKDCDPKDGEDIWEDDKQETEIIAVNEAQGRSNDDNHPGIPTVTISSQDQSDDVSTMTSVHSESGETENDPYRLYLDQEDSEDEYLDVEEKQRRAKIRKLMYKGDWYGIQTNATSFEISDEESISSPTGLELQRSSSDKRRSAKVDKDFPSLDDALFARLDSAVHAGDWAAVAKIASDLNDSSGIE